MPKQCLYEDCTFNQWGGGYCLRHQWCRTDKKPKQITRTPIRKISKKKASTLGERKLEQEKDWAFYLTIWDERNHICYETDQWLGTEPLTTFFHHVLPKGTRKYKKYRYAKWNIVIVSLETHSKAENNIKFVPRIQEYRRFLIKNLDKIEAGIIKPQPF